MDSGVQERFYQFEAAFDNCAYSCLAYTRLPCILDTDASIIGIGVVLSQANGDEEHLVAYTNGACPKQNVTLLREPEIQQWWCTLLSTLMFASWKESFCSKLTTVPQHG